MKPISICIHTVVQAPITLVWELWTNPKHIVHWNFASQDWCCPKAINELQPGGQLNWRMEAKDGSVGFDFIGTYQEISEMKKLSYVIADGRKVSIEFSQLNNMVKVTETFEAESIHTPEQQKAGWQAILDNFKTYVESQMSLEP